MKHDAPKRRRKKITPEEVKESAEGGAIADQNALRGAESMRRMFAALAYGGPTWPDGGFSDLAVLFAQRGLRWAKLAQGDGVAASNRRLVTGSREKFGYGILKPQSAPPTFPAQDEYDRAKKRQLAELANITQEAVDAAHWGF